MFDTCVHLLDMFQETDGVGTLLECMEKNGVERAIVCGTPVTKKWDQYEKGRPKGTFQDTGRIYFFTATDEMLADELNEFPDQAKVTEKLVPFSCGFNPTDLFATKHCKRVLDKFPMFKGVGELFMRYSEISMLTNEEVTRANHPAMQEIYEMCSAKGIPVMMHSNAGNESVKPYAEDFEYMHEIYSTLEKHRELKLILNGCGMFERGTWINYSDEMQGALVKYPNLMFCITSWNLIGCTNALKHEDLAAMIEMYPTRFCVATDCSGKFVAPDGPPMVPPFPYDKAAGAIKDFASKYLTAETQKKVLSENIKAFIGL